MLRRRLGAPACEDAAVFEEADPSHFVSLTRTKDWGCVLVNSHSKLTSEVGRGVGVGRAAHPLRGRPALRHGARAAHCPSVRAP